MFRRGNVDRMEAASVNVRGLVLANSCSTILPLDNSGPRTCVFSSSRNVNWQSYHVCFYLRRIPFFLISPTQYPRLKQPGKEDEARRADADVVAFYSSEHPGSTSHGPAALLQIENIVTEQLKQTRYIRSRGMSIDIAAIVFIHGKDLDKSVSFPFTRESHFLSLEGEALFRKLVVVQAAAENTLQVGWSSLLNTGMRVLSGNGRPQELLEQILSNEAPGSNRSASTERTPQTLLASGNSKLDEQARLLQLYKDWARATGRHYDQAVILLVGYSGHGKSKTINRLIGHDLLEVVQRVKMPVPASNTEPAVTLAFDDTPGYADNTYHDRGPNLALTKIYQERYFSENATIPWRRYPNVVLLVTSWNTITVDAHNSPENFTSPIGQTMFKLSHAGLVDLYRTNIIVVVTKCLSFMSEFGDYKTEPEKHQQWNIEAGRRTGIVTDLQRKVFPKSISWPIVFIENGGGQQVHQPYPRLPNGELSHQNLFDAIRTVIEAPGPEGASDLAGIQALQLVTGAKPFGSSCQPQSEILIDKTAEDMPSVIQDLGISSTQPQPSGRSRGLADQFLGVTYDPISGSYGRTCVLKLDPSEVIFRKGSGADMHFTQAEDVQEESTAVAIHLRCDFDVPQLARLSAHYSTSDGIKHAWNRGSQLYVSQYLMEEVAVDPLCPEVSKDMLKIISKLPPWSEQSKPQYNDFFRSHGTHVVLRLALGGKIRIVVENARAVDEHHHARQGQAGIKLPVPSEFGIEIGGIAGRETKRTAVDALERREIRIFVDGGGSLAGELIGKLEDHFRRLPPDLPDECSWPDGEIRTKWTKALESNPAFCPDHISTEFRWLHTLGGLSPAQQRDLRMASELYLKTRLERKPDASQSDSRRRKIEEDLP
ncbi:hypothetical protein C8F04DRAFT_1178394 [Mycena alexandri]|uniref:MACPF domain-containing protein n=1 Tax=Mycena alexandri TaxID=1745969 RepID=A0AAD6X979_9AGAR|nr:hypothetical protein C8F04DRAFT_1178394 [Mycena alexandri]